MTGCTPFPLDLAADQSTLPHFEPAPCQVACPIGTDVASYVGMIWAGDTAGALEAITATNPFSGVCGHVCDAPCEPACRRANADGTVAIRALKRYVMDKLGPAFRLPPVTPSRKERVAIIGAGPAGLTAAQDLAAAGCHVDIYEAQAKAGGMMAWGIPDFRLPPEVVEQDVARILERCPGIALHLSMPLGGGITLEELTHTHDAILLAVGAPNGRTLGIPGEDLTQIVDGVTFLRRVNGGERPTLPRHVVVVGGGDVAMDACRTARRLPGVEKVTVLYRRGPNEIPARAHELSAAAAEGIEIVYNVAPLSVHGAIEGMVRFRLSRTAPGEPGPDGRRAFRIIGGSEFDMVAGLVIAAVGQKTAVPALSTHGLLDGDRVATDLATLRTPMAKVFAAGDAATGSSTIVQAMHQGHKAAYTILAALDGEANPVPYRTLYRTRDVPVAQDPRWEVLGLEHPRFLGLRDEPFADSEAGYDDDTARDQAARCYRCDTETGSTDYTVKFRESVFALAKAGRTEDDLARLTRQRNAVRPDPFPAGHAVTFDDLVFLPANLTRLVIDPYRENCRTKTDLGGALALDLPALFGGFDGAPGEVRAAIGRAVADAKTAYAGREPLPGASIPWIQFVDHPADGDPAAAAVLLITKPHRRLALPVAKRDGQRVGLSVTTATAAKAIPFAIKAGAQLIILDGTNHLGDQWGELSGAPDLSLLSMAVRLFRAANAEETIPLLWFGGLRSGSDLAKALALGCDGGVFAMAAALAAGGEIDAKGVAFPDRDAMERTKAVAAFLKAVNSECSMMARCTGKTGVHNLEPEDLRTITLAAEKATLIAMAGQRRSA